MNVKALRLKLVKYLKSNPSAIRSDRNLSIRLLIGNAEVLELSAEYDSKELSWLGFQEGSDLLVR